MKHTPTKKVIDADNQKVIAQFDESETENKVKYYESLGKWSDVSVDRDGDIILWEN
jgi:hypothetical protein